MSVITGLKTGKRREKRVNVFLDDSFAFSLEAEVVAKAALRVGQELTPRQEEELSGADRYQRCLNAASRFLSYRPRSESEVRQRLLKHGYDAVSIDKAINRLKELELVDDTEFARFWAENREQFSPRSRRLMKLELQRKGLERDIIEQVITGVNEDESAYRAAGKKVRSLPLSDYQVFRQRLAAYLGRRGFSYDVVKRTIEIIWKENSNVPT
ncbi:MAG: RecX family transcriptional regulator [Dehalococcoidales bacterium]|nr:RecX family transcriptional regulator [Dehalococcoidales bacterium]